MNQTDSVINEWYKDVLENSLDMIYVVNLEGDFLDANHIALNALGYSREEILEESFKNLVGKEHYTKLADAIKEIIKFGKLTNYLDIKIKKKDGKLIHIEMYGVPLKRNGNINGILCIARFFTTHDGTEQGLRRPDQYYHMIFENANDLIVIIDNAYKYEYINEKAHLNLMGYTKEEIIGKSVIEFIHPDDIESALMSLKKGFKFGQGFGEIRIKNKKGDWVWLEVKGKKFIDTAGQEKGIIISRDVTHRKITEIQLIESEKKYRDILENMREGYYEVDLNGNFTFCNKRMCEFIGYSKDEILNKNFRSIISKHNVDIVFKYFNNLFKGNSISELIEIEVLNKEGALYYVQNLVSLKTASDGKKIGFTGLARDLTERKKLEYKLLESEEKYRLISENANDLIGILNEKFELEYVNEQTCINIIGYTNEDVLGRSPLEFVHRDDVKKGFEALQLGLKQGIGVSEIRIKRKDGNYIWFEVKGRTFYTNLGELKGIIIGRDITERKKAELNLLNSEENYRLISENANDLIRVLNKNFRISYINEKAHLRSLGYKKEDLSEKVATFITHPDEIKQISQSLRDLLDKGESWREGRIRHKDGHWIWYDIRTKLFKDSNEELKGLVISRDITERKKVEKLIQKEMDKLKELDKLKNEIITRTSHELKTPITSIYGASQLLYELYKDTLPKQALELVEIALMGGKRVKQLINNILDVSKFESGLITLNKQRENIVHLIEGCIKEVSYLCLKSNVHVQFDSPKTVYLKIDKFQIEEVIFNILINAIKNTPFGGKILCKLKTDENSIIISVKDWGIGIRKGEMQNLFKKFGKIERFGKNMNVDIEGTGLGLYISKQIVDLHEGEIWAESAGLHKGSTFNIRLPLY